MLVSDEHIREIFDEAVSLPTVRDAIAEGKPRPTLFRISRRELKGGPCSFRGFARFRTGEISISLGALCDEANAAFLILHEIAHIASPERGHGAWFRLTLCHLVDDLYGIRLFEFSSERYHCLDARAGIAIARLLSESFGEREPTEESSAWWVIERSGRRSWPRYFTRSERKAWEAKEEEKAARIARARARLIAADRRVAAAAGRIA